ncbi:MAG: antibiotic biosynthesis monooxygenase [Thermoanaerobaculia bacterium]
MIGRTWRGRTRREKADEYLRYLQETAIPAYRSTEGNLRVMVLRRDNGDVTEFILFTLWSSIEAVCRYAGDNPETAVYYPDDRRYLLEMEAKVRLYEIAEDLG